MRGPKTCRLFGSLVGVVILVSGCSSESSVSSPETPSISACSDVTSIWKRAETTYGSGLAQVGGDVDQTYGLAKVSARLESKKVLQEGFASVWPVTTNPDLKEILKELAKGSGWSSNINALISICSLTPLYPEFADLDRS